MNNTVSSAHSNKRKGPDDGALFDPTAVPPLGAVLPSVSTTMTSRQQEESAETATETQCASSHPPTKKYRADSIPDLKQDQTSLAETVKAQTSSSYGNTNTCTTQSHGRISNSPPAVVGTSVDPLLITPSPKKQNSVILSIEVLPGSIGMELKLDKIGFKVTHILTSSQLLGKVQIGDWLISVDRVELQNLTSADYFVQYLRKHVDVRKVFQIKRTASLPPRSALDLLAHAAEEMTQKHLTPPVYSEDRNKNCVSKTSFIEEDSTNVQENVADKSIIDSISGEEMVSTESCQPMGTHEYHANLEYAHIEMNENDHISEEQAVVPNTVLDISNGLVGVQAAEPVPPSPLQTTKPKRKQSISFDKRIEELKRFKEKHGHCDISQSKSSKEYNSLAQWSTSMRCAYKGNAKSKLPEDRIRRLEEIGFKWNLSSSTDRSDISFLERIEELKRFKDKHGHCNVSRSMSSQEYNSLVQWSANTRCAYNAKENSKLTEDRIRRLEEIGFKWTTSTSSYFQKDSKCDLVGRTLNKEDAEYLASDDETSAIQYQNDKGVQKTVTTSGSLDQCESTKRKKRTNHNQSDRRMVPNSPGSPAFDPSRYSLEELQDAMEESKRVCREMQRRDAARLDEIATRLFESDDDETENNFDEDSADGPNDDEEM